MNTLEEAIIAEAGRRGFHRPHFRRNGALAFRTGWFARSVYVPHKIARNITHTVIRNATVYD